MRWYAFAIFLSAFLLFQVQPLIGKSILPWFGGAPAVWTTCMLFFQVLLLAGYTYAHLSVRYLPTKRQGYLHAFLLMTSILSLPIIPGDRWKPTDGSDPTLSILALLLITVGVPYLLLSSTAPLLQNWFYDRYGKPPFRLYALSNAASLLALFTYPLIVEYFLGSTAQAWTWSISYFLFIAVCMALALKIRSNSTPAQDKNTPQQHRYPTKGDMVLWLCLTATSSTVLLATTNQLCLDIAPIPFLWILPLSLYLLSFVVCFDTERCYRRSWYHLFLVIAIFLYIINMMNTSASILQMILLYSFTLFVCCMICHGELVRLKPDPHYLSLFYLMIALGGALGGVFVTFIAPLMFVQFHEYIVGLGATCLLALVSKRYEKSAFGSAATCHRTPNIRGYTFSAIGVIFCSTTFFFLGFNKPSSQEYTEQDRVLERSRNFYGILSVIRKNSANKEDDQIVLSNGTTIHGYQFKNEERRQEPTSYYVRDSGVGLSIDRHPKRLEGQPINIGVVGFGCGTLSAYMNKGDVLHFYEIDPEVLDLSRKYFTFEQDALARGAEINVYMGDARITMEHQLQQGQPKNFDILVVDAFTSDSIPIHLLTKECFDVYWQHLDKHGILAVHISNRFLDIAPIVRTFAKSSGKNAHKISLVGKTDWVLVTDNKQFLNDEKIVAALDPDTPFQRIEWTDSFSSLFPILK